MWILPSLIRSDFAAASGCLKKPSASDASISAGEPSLRACVSGKPTLRPFSWRGWRTRAWSRALFGAAICEISTARRFAEWWTSSQRDCRVPRSVSPESKPDSMTIGPGAATTVLSRNSCESFPSVDPPWSLSKMCRPLFAEDSFGQLERNYQDWVTKLNALSLSLRSRLVRATSGSECLFWPTIDTNTSTYSNGERGQNLREAAAMWPSPRSESCGNHPGATDSLTGATGLLATPNVPSLGAETDKNARPLNEQALTDFLLPALTPTGETSPKRSGRRLNPAFVCLLMGWPWWWTRAEPISFGAAAMASWRRAQQWHLSNLLGELSRIT